MPLHYLGPGDATTIVYMPTEQIIATANLYEPRALTRKNRVHDKPLPAPAASSTPSAHGTSPTPSTPIPPEPTRLT